MPLQDGRVDEVGSSAGNGRLGEPIAPWSRRNAGQRAAPAPTPGSGARLDRYRGLVQLVGLLWVYALYDQLRAHVTGTSAVAAQHARALLGIERSLGLNLEHDVQAATLHLPWLVAVCNLSYDTLHLVVPPIVLVVLYRRCPDQYRHWRNVFVIMLGLALLGFWLYPMMPPRLVTGPDHLLDTSTQFLSLARTPLASMAGTTSGSGPSVTGVTNPYAAMPSLHVGWAVWAMAALWPLTRRRRTRLALAAYPIFMVFVVLVTANHWVLDAAAGAALVGVAHALASAAERCGSRVAAARARLATS